MKQCRYCKKKYPESDFHVALTTEKKIYRRHKCKYCYRKTKKSLAKKYQKWLNDYKRKRKCNHCGTDDYRVLEFHHIDDRMKNFSIATAFYNHYGLKRIKKEVKKCIVLCANCHRILHYKNRGKNRKNKNKLF